MFENMSHARRILRGSAEVYSEYFVLVIVGQRQQLCPRSMSVETRLRIEFFQMLFTQ